MPARTIYLIKRLEVAVRTALEVELRDLDLTPSQYTTLSILAASGEMSASDLARRVLVTPQSMSEMIGALDRKGLIDRTPRQANRRVLHISLSSSGRRLLDEAEARVDAMETSLFSQMTPADLEGFRGLLKAALA